MRKFGRILALLLVAVSSAFGLASLPDEFRNLGGTLPQQSVAFGAALHSALGVLVVVGALRRRSWAVTAAIAWTLAVVYTASVASVAWEPQLNGGVITGGIAAGISCALLGWWAVWATKSWVSRAGSPEPESARDR